MEQERMLWQLQELVQEEFVLKKKQEIIPLIKHLKELQDTIKGTEEETLRLQQEIDEAQQKAGKLEKQINTISKQVKGGKEKLFGSKGGSLKELLSLQQSIFKMETEAEKGETDYFENMKKIDELNEKLDQAKAVAKELKKQYNQEVKVYKERLNQIDLKLAENRLGQERLREELAPEILRLFTETERRYPRNPIAAMKAGSCTGCHISIPAMLVSRVREGKSLYRCESCGRILINPVK